MVVICQASSFFVCLTLSSFYLLVHKVVVTNTPKINFFSLLCIILTAFSKNDEKSAWSVASSDPFYSDKLLAGEVINGVTTTAHEVGYFSSDHVLHPWLEIDLGTARWVKGMEVRGGYDLIPQRFKHLEVRVGNESAIGTADDQRICKNQVCCAVGFSRYHATQILFFTS